MNTVDVTIGGDRESGLYFNEGKQGKCKDHFPDVSAQPITDRDIEAEHAFPFCDECVEDRLEAGLVRIEAIRATDPLGLDDQTITEGYNEKHFDVNWRKRKRGNSPQHFRDLADNIHAFLSDADADAISWEQLVMRYTDSNAACKSLERLMPTGDMHLYPNGLYHLLCSAPDDDSWHVYAIRTAFNGGEIEDKRPTVTVTDCEFVAMTDEEADEEAAAYIESSLWALNAYFLASETGLPQEIFEALQPQCENANDAILAVVEKEPGLDRFVEAVIGADGRGHSISTYDGKEHSIANSELRKRVFTEFGMTTDSKFTEAVETLFGFLDDSEDAMARQLGNDDDDVYVYRIH